MTEETTEQPGATNGTLRVTTAAEWKQLRHRWWWITLPSGGVVKAHRPDWYGLIKDGVIDADDLMAVDTRERKLGTMITRLYPVARRCLRHIVFDPAFDEVFTEDDISVSDTVALFAWANGQTAAVQSQAGE